jgi:hypothetical protein
MISRHPIVTVKSCGPRYGHVTVLLSDSSYEQELIIENHKDSGLVLKLGKYDKETVGIVRGDVPADGKVKIVKGPLKGTLGDIYGKEIVLDPNCEKYPIKSKYMDLVFFEIQDLRFVYNRTYETTHMMPMEKPPFYYLTTDEYRTIDLKGLMRGEEKDPDGVLCAQYSVSSKGLLLYRIKNGEVVLHRPKDIPRENLRRDGGVLLTELDELSEILISWFPELDYNAMKENSLELWESMLDPMECVNEQYISLTKLKDKVEYIKDENNLRKASYMEFFD